MTSRPTIAVDVDEVLAQYLASCNAWHNRVYHTDFKLSDYQSYNFCETWQCSDEEARHRVYQFYAAPEFASLPPVEGSQEGVERLSRHFDLVVVTSRQTFIADITRQWLKEHFGATCFREVLFGNMWVADETAHKRSKREMCEQVGAVALIDDLPHYIIDVAQAGIKPLLFDLKGQQGWSKVPAGLEVPGLKVCHDWGQVVAECESLIPSVMRTGDALAHEQQTEGEPVTAVRAD